MRFYKRLLILALKRHMKLPTTIASTHLKKINFSAAFRKINVRHVISQQQYQQIKQERDGFAHEKSAVEQLLADSKIEAATLIEKLAGFEQQNQEKQVRIEELRQQNQQIQANLEHYRAASLEQRMADQQRYEQHQKQLEQALQQLIKNWHKLDKKSWGFSNNIDRLLLKIAA
jgi:chromosome segregation ATPase